MATWLKSDGSEEEIFPKDGKKFSMEELQQYVGGYFEKIELGGKPPSRMWINEDGISLSLPRNQKATALAEGKANMLVYIRGNVVIETMEGREYYDRSYTKSPQEAAE